MKTGQRFLALAETWEEVGSCYSQHYNNKTLDKLEVDILKIWLSGTETTRCHNLEEVFNGDFDKLLEAECRQVGDWKAPRDDGLSWLLYFDSYIWNPTRYSGKGSKWTSHVALVMKPSQTLLPNKAFISRGMLLLQRAILKLHPGQRNRTWHCFSYLQPSYFT